MRMMLIDRDDQVIFATTIYVDYTRNIEKMLKKIVEDRSLVDD